MKKRLTIFFTVAMLISCCAFIACSGGDVKLKFELNEDGESYCVVGLENFKATNVKIPSTYNDKSVTSIEARAFEDYKRLQSIEIPSSVTSIGEGAFSGCKNLIEVYYKGDIASWCNIEFSDDYSNPLRNVAKLYIVDTEVIDLEIPEEVTEIKTAFAGCSSLQSVTFAEENKIQSFEDCAFTGCDKLQSIEISASVTSIGEMAFYGCTKLHSVYYHGSQSNWKNIQIDEFGNDALKTAMIYYYYATDPKTEQGYNPDLHYWYRDGDEIKIW